MAVTPVALWLALVSANAGHGTYTVAKLFFPFTFLLTRLSGDVITNLLIVLALAQFPFYGWFVASFTTARALLVLSLAHAAAALLCFSGWLPAFS